MTFTSIARPYHNAVVDAAYSIALTNAGVTFRGGIKDRLPTQDEFSGSLVPGQPAGYYLAIMQPQPVSGKPTVRDMGLWESWKELRLYAIGPPAGADPPDPTVLADLQDTCDLLEATFVQYLDLNGTCEPDTVITNAGAGILNPTEIAVRWYASQLRIQYHLILPFTP